MVRARSATGKNLARRWGLQVRHALYRETGDWYHQLRRFPGALLDARGYVIFATADAYRSCPELRILQDVAVRNGISRIAGYTRVVDDSGRDVLPRAAASYERALFREGRLTDVTQSRRERDPVARAACIAAHGYSCATCGMDFARRYGAIGQRFIHIHHITPLAEGEREVDPVADLRPLCPNCHAMVHRRAPPLSLDELSQLLARPAEATS